MAQRSSFVLASTPLPPPDLLTETGCSHLCQVFHPPYDFSLQISKQEVHRIIYIRHINLQILVWFPMLRHRPKRRRMRRCLVPHLMLLLKLCRVWLMRLWRQHRPLLQMLLGMSLSSSRILNENDCCYRVKKRKRTETSPKNTFPHVVEQVRPIFPTVRSFLAPV